MSTALLVAASILVVVADAIHVVIFALESVLWRKPATWKRFGLRSQADADTVRPMAFNQGFYNLFLAIGAFVGVALIASGLPTPGYTLALASVLSMVAAATVLIASNPRLARAAVTQGAAPLVGLVLLLVTLVAA
jgi:putative membrane protein